MFIGKSTLHFNFVVCTTAYKTKKDRRFIHFHKEIKCNKIQKDELPKVLPLFTASSAIKLRINKIPSKEVDGELCSRYFVVYIVKKTKREGLLGVIPFTIPILLYYFNF